MRRFTVLGCGSSLGSPWINKYKGILNLKNKRNIRTRCCAHIQYDKLSIILDTSPDIKKQILDNNIKNVDSILYTHEHTDQSSGIFEMRPFFWQNKKKIPIYGSKRTIKELVSKYTFCFKKRFGYSPIMKSNIVNRSFYIKKGKSQLRVTPFQVKHGQIESTGYRFKNICYISDCNQIYKKSFNCLKKLDCLIIDSLRRKKHPSHFNVEDALKLIHEVKPKRGILTNLHVDLDYDILKKELPKNVVPAYDGMSFSF